MQLENSPTWLLVVAAAFLNAEGRLLMQRRPPGKHHAGLWEFPGGKVKPGENPEDALIREVAEELAVDLYEGTLLPNCFAQTPGDGLHPPIVILLYTVSEWNGTPTACDGAEVGWFSPSEAQELAKPPLDVSLLSRLIRSGVL